jgi:hypothetical protein
LNVYLRPGFQLVSNTQIPLLPGHFSTNGVVTYWVTNISAAACPPFTPGGTICTNIYASNVLTAGVFGDYFILPTNSCDIALVSTQYFAPVTVTNATSSRPMHQARPMQRMNFSR